MKAMGNGLGSSLTRILAICSASIFGIAILASPAHADGWYRWQNAETNNYLEVWHSGLNNYDQVITWPSNDQSWNQFWYDTKQSDGYYVLRNGNSNRYLNVDDATWFAPTETVNGPLDCNVVQLYLGQPYSNTQKWRYQDQWSAHLQRYHTEWINRYGCQGDPYQDTLAAVNDHLNVRVGREVQCDHEGAYTPVWCWWKRNGQ